MRGRLQQWIDRVIIGTTYLEQIDHRIEVLDGYHIACLNIEKMIAIFRSGGDVRHKLAEGLKLTSTQIDAILDLRLGALPSLEEVVTETRKLWGVRREIKHSYKYKIGEL